MPKVSQLQESFNGGEFSPMAQGRVSSDNYKKGLANCLNYVPTLQGPLIRRPGTAFAGFGQVSLIGPNVPSLIPFVFSQTQAYMLEFGQNYITFYANNGQVLSGSTLYQVQGLVQSKVNYFYGTRTVYEAKTGESIFHSSVIGALLQVQTPYNYYDIPNIKWAQSADTLYLTHPNYPAMKLQRFGLFDWRLQQVYWQDGPYLALNSYAQTGDSTNIGFLPQGSSGWVGSQIAFQTGAQVSQTVFANDIQYLTSGVGQNVSVVTVAPHGFSSGQHITLTGVGNGFNSLIGTFTPQTPTLPWYRTIQVVDFHTFTILGTTSGSGTTNAGVIRPALFQNASSDVGRLLGVQQSFTLGENVPINAGQRVWGQITSIPTADTAIVQIDANSTISGQTGMLANTSSIQFWYLGVFSGQLNAVIGFQSGASQTNAPANCCFHQDRLNLSGSPNFPQQIDGSMIGNFETFSPSVATGSTALQVQQNNAYQFTLNSTDVNALQWMKSTAQGLVAASYSNEWCVTPSSQATAISPSNVNAQQTSFFGGANIDAVVAGNAVLYVQRAQRKVREMNYFFQVGTFRSTDLTEISEHITLPTITKLAVQKETQPLIWGVISDGSLVSMTYNRDDTSISAGWARHELGGRSDAAGSPPRVVSIATIPDPTGTYDQLWMVTQRYLNGGTTNYCIEYMTNFFNDSMSQEEAFQGDCGFTYDFPVTLNSIVNSGIFTIVNVSSGLSFTNSGVFEVKFTNVLGVNSSSIDINGNVTLTNALNEKYFYAASCTTTSFYLQDLSNNYVSLENMSTYVGSGLVRQMLSSIQTGGNPYLNGETVNVLADGGNHPVVVPSGIFGAIQLQYPAATVQIGYAFPSQAQLLRSSEGSAQGSAIGSTRRVNRAAFMLHDVGDFSYGMSLTNLISRNFNTDRQSADIAAPLFSGLIRDGIEAAYDFENQLWFQQNSMLPGMVQAVTTFFEENDV